MRADEGVRGRTRANEGGRGPMRVDKGRECFLEPLRKTL